MDSRRRESRGTSWTRAICQQWRTSLHNFVRHNPVHLLLTRHSHRRGSIIRLISLDAHRQRRTHSSPTHLFRMILMTRTWCWDRWPVGRRLKTQWRLIGTRTHQTQTPHSSSIRRAIVCTVMLHANRLIGLLNQIKNPFQSPSTRVLIQRSITRISWTDFSKRLKISHRRSLPLELVLGTGVPLDQDRHSSNPQIGHLPKTLLHTSHRDLRIIMKQIEPVPNSQLWWKFKSIYMHLLS